ncbi:erythrocyte membrane protein 1, PfEMP1, putative [Plasmodium sp. gorilla clade G2]|uniref:erythrocyte membrane protein 1, PfEMP1, putative n=1 Tax=Plasmodium sp. gorilla clade G2 TaxID=880535 RepID=UPI000D225372|nr:erythrocyte membrane protein 1, PfEMP1, putative [Plasmodium sp. gorilla clade G2]SOV11084.1 erythrocyte membrane protein 1, PfEMP1, putative [Plasmodium sp. gorilla clade G2]
MGNEISGRQTAVYNKYEIDVYSKTKWYHGDYINFLIDEIQKETWKNDKYKNYMKDNEGNDINEPDKQFCKWREIQREIFEAVLDNHRLILYTWEDRAKGLIDEAHRTKFPRHECEEVKEHKNEDSDRTPSTDSNDASTSSEKTIDLGICLPNRRKNINYRLRNIEKQIKDIQGQVDGSDIAKAKIAATTVIGSLANQTKNEIDNLLKHYPHNTELICELIARTYADYKDISKGKDILKHDVSQNVQKLLNYIVDKIGEKEMDKLWEKHFKNTIEDKLKILNIYEKNSNKQKLCTLDHSQQQIPQCLRYMQEWFENFLEQKEFIANRMKRICTGELKIQKTHNINYIYFCQQFCNNYNALLHSSKSCYEKYKSQCEKNLKRDSTYSTNPIYNADIQSLERQIKTKSGCGNTCGTLGKVDLSPLFNEKDSSTNKSYYCHCNGQQNKDKPPCNNQQPKPTMSLKGEWKKGIHKISKTPPHNACDLQFGDHNSTGGGGANPCGGIPSGTSWICDRNNTFEEGICLPPRRQRLCISNIRNLKDNDIKSMDSNKLLLELMLAAKSEAGRLRNQKRGSSACDSIKLSFYDFGNIIKGTDKAKDNNSVETEQILRKIFEKLSNEWKKNGDEKYETTTSYDGLGELRKDWWEENKKDIWEAFKCDGTTKKACDGNETPQDNRSQFLRWLDEWATEFCSERKNKEQAVNVACQTCDDDVCEPSIWSSFSSSWWKAPSICDCKNKCKEYSNWIHDKKMEFGNQKKYFDEKLTIIDIGETSRRTHNSTTKSSVSEYLKPKMTNECNYIDFSKSETIFSSYPDESSQYRHKCSKCYAQLEADLTYKDSKTPTAVCAVHQILTRENSNLTQTCNDKNTTPKQGDDAVWKEKKISSTYSHTVSSAINVGVPPRYEGICKDSIEKNNSARDDHIFKQDFYYNNRMLLSELILIAKHEGKNLYEHYMSENDKNVLCTAMQRSFSDIGDIVKGTNLVDTDDNNKVEQHLKEMFTKLRDEYKWFGSDYYIYYGDDGLSLFRKNWWERNRHMIWEAFECNGRNKECPNHNDIDKVPQLLRWLEEWSEDFYEQRQKKIEELRIHCDKCTMNHDQNQPNNSQKCNPQDKCKICKDKCDDYKKWIEKWKEQWELLKKYYDEQNNKNYNEFNNHVKDIDISQYVVNKLKDIGCNNITSFDESDAFANYPNSYEKICNCVPTDTSSSILTKDENNCNDNFKSQWNCEETNGPTTKGERNMCVRNDGNIGDNIDNVDANMLFFNSFTQWLDEISYNMKENSNTVSQTCNKEIIGGTPKNNTINVKCKECRKNCKCYEKWKEKITEQWKKQQQYYSKYEDKQGNQMSGIDLNDFLYAYCFIKDEKRTEKECSPKDTSKNIIDEKIDDIDIRNTNVCGICPDDPTNNKGGAGDNCNNSGTTSLTGNCTQKEYDNIQNNGYKKDWTVAKKNKQQEEPGVYVPPRRQQLCISYLKDNEDINVEGKLKNVLIKAIKSEIEKLYEYYQYTKMNYKPVNSDESNLDENGLPIGFCKAVERSFADLGDFVKGTNLDYAGQSQDVKSKLDTFFKDKTKIPVDRKTWWEQNKRDLWKAVKCGINGGNDGLDCPQNIDFDRRDQFLRWFEEWGEYVCIEHKKKLAYLKEQCKNCDNGLNCGIKSGSSRGASTGGTNTCNSGNCTKACGNYKAWIDKRKKEWNKILEKYNEKQRQYKDDDEDEATFWAKHMPASTYLKFFNTDTCYKTFFNKLFYDKYDYGDQQTLCECNEYKKKIIIPSEEDDPADDKIKDEPCKVNIITTKLSSCHEKNFDGVVWSSRNVRTDENGQRMFGVYAPPRRQKLCVGNIWQYATDENTLLNELILASKKEGEYLKKHYDEKKSGSKGSSGKYSEFCKALERSFYDFGDIVKGIDLRRGAIVTATEKTIHEIFKKELNTSNSGGKPHSEDKIEKERKKWWDKNKEKVWKAMTCGNICYGSIPSDTSPQVLRWYEEWYEDFCEHRKQLLKNISDKCSGKKADDKCDDKDKECETACSKYSNWLTPKNFEWRAQKKNYQTKKVNEHMEENEFHNITKGKNTIEHYLKDRCECDKTKIDDMDKIVEKNDDDYKTKYEPLCSICRMKNIIDKAKEKQNQKNKYPPAPISPIEDICTNGKVDCSNVNDKGDIKVPMDPQTSGNTDRNKDGTSDNCGGIPSVTSQIKWKNKDDSDYKNLDNGVYVSPRRQKLCVKDLHQATSTDELKTKLLTVAANQGYNLAIKYDDYKDTYTVSPCNALKYSFYDYKHIILGDDPLEPDTNPTGQKLKERFQKSIGNDSKDEKKLKEKRQNFWETNKKCVWDAMKCGYKEGKKKVEEKGKTSVLDIKDCTQNSPTEFDEVPQFLMWFTEWTEDFCNKKNKQLQNLKGKCPHSTCSNDSMKKECEAACAEYKQFIEKWKEQYDKQSTKFTTDKNEGKYDAVSDAKHSRYAYQYLEKTLKKLFNCGSNSGNCNCMGKSSSQSKQSSLPESLDDLTTSEYKYRCECPASPIPTAPAGSNNPCVANTIKPTKNVTDIAKEMQEKANQKMKTNSVNGSGEDELKGDISQAEFKNGIKLNTKNICDLYKKTHTNDGRTYTDDPNPGGGKHNGPCTGKGGSTKERFKIGKKWGPHNDVEAQHKDVLFPPRRLDMCTSNLENLNTNVPGLKDGNKAIHSLLGDVLLTAKIEAQNIIDLYKTNDGKSGLSDPKDKETVCREMKYSFADLGDIIRGRDIWTENGDMKQLEGKLKIIFSKIKENTRLKGIYNHGTPYTELRNDWWALNRDQVWQAMTCALEKDKISTTDCKYIATSGSPRPSGLTTTPFDDYIPQKLRWITEWSEWYCKKQSQLYNDLVGECKDCKSNTKCSQCKDCQAKCELYKTEVEKWETDWKTMEGQYKKFYSDAKTKDGSDENEKYLYQFLKKLEDQNSGNKTYESAAGYVHEVLKDMECKEQKEFCDKKNSVTNPNYAFKSKPKNYGTACSCIHSTVPQAPQGTKTSECKINEYIQQNDTTYSGSKKPCNEKTGNPKPWDCGDVVKPVVSKNGECMPPRRQSLCIFYLKESSVTNKDKLKEAFIKSASIETYLLWKKYNEDHPVEKQKLKNEGTIPEEFKRQMFYTLGDFRDLCLGTDISENNNNNKNVREAKGKITDVFKKNGKHGDENPNSQERQTWWKGIEEQVWEAMVCSLSYDEGTKSIDTGTRDKLKGKYDHDKVFFDTTNGTSLPHFVARPQFLRWMVEWGEDYCKTQAKEYNDLVTKCKDYECNGNQSNKGKCEDACTKYRNFIKQWNVHYDKQSGKYSQVKNQKEYKDADEDVKNSSDARNYLKKKLEKMQCTNSGTSQKCDYKCMDETSKQNGKDIPKSLKETPDIVDGKCPCPAKPPPAPQQKDSCHIVDTILNNNNANGDIDGCKKKYDQQKPNGGYPGWKCEENQFESGHKDACMPPRRQKLCLYYLTQQNISDKEKLREAYIKTAAAETFLHWQYYKQHGGNTEAQKLLEKGEIPPEFLRYMFYTYGDFRDLCLNTDMSVIDIGKNKDVTTARQKITTALKNGSQEPNDAKRKQWWDENGPDIWKGMVCGLSHHISDRETRNKITNNNKNKRSQEYFAKRHQFLRWFAEWGDDYCQKRRNLELEVKNECKKHNDYDGCKDNNNDNTCVNACKAYDGYVTKKKGEYQKQRTKFDEDKSRSPLIDGYKDFSNKDAHDYLKDKCLDGTCSCMQKVKDNNFYWDEPFKTYETNNLEKKCECAPTPQPSPFPIQPQPITENMSCVEKVAYKLQKEAEKNVNSNLKGTPQTNFYDECNNVHDVVQGKQGYKTINKGNLDTIFPTNEDSCENDGTDRLNAGKTWRCDNINNRQNNLCLPPRREHICIKKIQTMMSSKIDNENKLLKEVMEAAKNEGIDILKKLKPENETEFSDICDAMKYSFADIGDIIRGRDLWNKDPNFHRREPRLQNIFKKIHNNLETYKHKYPYDHPKYLKLREAWWNTNREAIWKAMTCAAPREANFLKRDENGTIISSQDKCGHDNDPPDDDYIPQPFRWMQEWSENYYKIRKKEIQNLQTSCKDCATSGSSCTNDVDGTKCEKCKETCKSYSVFVQQWQKQLDKQSKQYKNLYDEANKNSRNGSTTPTSSNGNNVTESRPRSRNRLTNTTLEDDDNKGINNFLKGVKTQCSDPNSVETYLDKANNYVNCTFGSDQKTDEKYAFKETPDGYENACECEAPDPLDDCPYKTNNNTYEKVCKNLSTTQTCDKKNFNNDLEEWSGNNVLNSSGINYGVLVPPRRKQLCLRNLATNLRGIKSKEDFKQKFIQYVYNEGKLLRDTYKHQPKKALEAMKYSFADYGDIIKRKDMMDNLSLLQSKLDELLKETGSNGQSDGREQWWEENKKNIWNAMLCGYKKSNKGPIDMDTNDICTFPKTEEDENQFLRWLTEWAKLFCYEKEKEAKRFVHECIKRQKVQGKSKSIDNIEDPYCKSVFDNYRNWYLKRRNQWEGLKEKYKKYKSLHENGNVQSSGGTDLQENAEKYVKGKCEQCDCTYTDLDTIYEKKDNQKELFTELINIATTDAYFPKNQLDPIHNLVQHATTLSRIAIQGVIQEPTKFVQDALQKIVSTTFETLAHIKKTINDIQEQKKNQNIKPPTPVAPTKPVQPSTPVLPTPDILSSTLPVGMSFALGSIALLFYIKKKPALRSTNLFRVIDIPQNDYSMPTHKSSNKYVPYRSHGYKGKTYIYVEGEETDDYVRDISSSDITSSSESEYEEIDINDIYPYKSPKYKTLIEVVLKPSTNNNVQDTYTDDVKDNSDKPTNKLTYNEWNRLKHDFISQYLPNVPKDLPNENTIDDNMPKDTQPNILPNNMEEKPFITSIQDRVLHGDNEVTYNINWNVPKHTQIYSNITHTHKDNSLYSGIDLINDSLNSNQHIDIYDELLKRKENELFETKHTKHTTTNSVVKETYSDPISNQIDLFHEWLDRHRDMCNKWNNKEEMLNQLNEEWKNENKEHVLDIPFNDNAIHKINDETYNMINANTNELNDITSLEDFGSTNIPYSDLITKNNNSQRQNLRKNISMDIDFDENNNITREDQLENMYNF